MPRSVVLDGEIVCLDKKGCPQFNDLLFHRGTPSFVAFDLLFDGNRDLRLGRLSDRRLELRRILDRSAPPVMFADHVEQCGTALFDKACDLDLEGIVAKRKSAPYLAVTEQTTWFKTRNPSYSQWVGRLSYSSVTVTANLFRAGIRATWHVPLRSKARERRERN